MSRSKVLLVISSFILFFSFIYFSYLVHKNIFTQFDFDMTVKLQDHLSRHWDLPFSILSLIGLAEVTGIVWLVFLFVTLWKKLWLTAGSLFLFWAGIFAELYGKIFLSQPGPPFMFYRGVISFQLPSSYVNTGNSYPSGHMFRTAFLATFLIIYFLQKKGASYKIFFLPILIGFLFVMGISRVYLGEHWTTDVIGGALLGSSLAAITAATLPKAKQAVN